MSLRLPLGISDFRKLREQNAEYIDKSQLIIDILDQAIEGEAQIRAHDYQAELRAAGATPVHAFAIAFDGKDVRVRHVDAPSAC